MLISVFSSQFNDIGKHNITGSVSGNFNYSREKSYFDGKFNFKGLASNFGEFGVVNMQFISNDGVLDILSLKTEGLHDAYLSATIVDRGDIQFQIYDQSMFDLSRIEFFEIGMWLAELRCKERDRITKMIFNFLVTLQRISYWWEI